MAGNKPINKSLRGIRDSQPPGYILGRTGGGNGPPILIPTSTFTTKGYVANTTIQVGGAAGGDLSGTYPNPTVAKINGNAVKAGTPSNNQVLTYITADTEWEPETPHYIPAGGTTGQALEKNSGTDYDVSWQTPASGGGATSIQDTGTQIEIALSDPAGQLVLDGSGNPIFSNEVFPPASLPTPTASTLGGVKSLAAVSHNFLTSITTAGLPVAAQPSSADLSDVSSGTWTPSDASGASLTLTVFVNTYYKIGKLVYVTFVVIYPSTADTSAAVIGGLPYSTGPQALCNGFAGVAAGSVLLTAPNNSTTMNVNTIQNTPINNATLSGNFVAGTFVYATA